MKIVINQCYGGFSITCSAIVKLRALGAEWALWPKCVVKGEKYKGEQTVSDHENVFTSGNDTRTCPHLIAMVEAGEPVSGRCSELGVVEVPDDVQWQVEEYDGVEHVAETHRTWP